MKVSKCVTAIGAAVVFSMGAFVSTAQAATVGFETIFRVSSQFPDYTSANGTPLRVELEYDDTGVVDASYSINGHEGAFDTVTLSTFYYYDTRVAYGQTPSYGVRVNFAISDDNIPLNIDLKNIAFLFATQPGSANPSAPLTEAELEAFFASATTAMATDYKYFNPYANRTRFYTGAFEGFSTFDVDGGEGGITDPVLETPIPAAGFLMLGGLGALGGFARRRKA